MRKIYYSTEYNTLNTLKLRRAYLLVYSSFSYLSQTARQSRQRRNNHSRSSRTNKFIILGCSLGMIMILIVSCVAINKRGWNIRVTNDSESGESGHDSQPGRSPIVSVDAVLNAEQPTKSGRKNESKENTDNKLS